MVIKTYNKKNKIDCFIPCRKNGDFLKNLNFLKIDQIQLVEHTIINSINSKIFTNIYLITNDKKSFLKLKKKFPFLKLIYTSSTKQPFYKIIEKLNKKKYFKEKINICVLLPNYPFKSHITIRKIYNKYNFLKLDLIMSAIKENTFYYEKKKNKAVSINFSPRIRIKKKIPPIIKLSGGIFVYNSEKRKLDLKKIDFKNLYFINNHESFGIYSLYDFVTASSLFNIDNSILFKMSK